MGTDLTKTSAADIVQTLEAERFKAIVDGRWDDFDAICHPELRYTHATGVVDTRATYLHKLRSGHYDYRYIEHTVEQTSSHRDTVLLWGTMTAELRAGEQSKTIHNRTLTVWVLLDNKWLLLAQQPTALPGKKTTS
jgi:hypothetical protein